MSMRGVPWRKATITGPRWIEPPEGPESEECPGCEQVVTPDDDDHERVVSCPECGYVFAAFDWDAEAERRAEAREWAGDGLEEW